MALKIHSYPSNPRVYKALIAAQYNNIQIELPAFEFGVTNKTPEFLAKFPLGKVPVMETPEGPLYESNAIARYVARARPLGSNVFLMGRTDMEQALVDQWLDFESLYLVPHQMEWLGQIHGFAGFNPGNLSKAKKALTSTLRILEAHLETRTFLVGERITLADICVAMDLFWSFKEVFDANYRRPFTNLTRWFMTVVNQPESQAVVGDFEICTVAKEPKKPEKKKPAQQPKAAQPKPAQQAAAPAPKKRVNPLDHLPASTFDFEWFKRLYMNCDSANDIMPQFWERWDAEGFCVYFCDYKYPEDNTNPLFVRNLLGGFFQRLDSLRRYGFGVVGIFGDAAPIELSGMWIFRGQEVPFEMSDCPDSESYTFRRADLTNEADKQLFVDFLNCEGSFGGRSKQLVDYKIFH